MELKRTPLYETHVRLGGRIVEFGGFEMPVQYPTGVIKEHMAVREACGLFDVSHMGEVLMEGPDAVKNLNHLLTNDYTEMEDGQARYSPMCNEQGGTVDDLIVYRVSDNHYFIVVNASNREKDVAWIQAHVSGDVKVTDVSDSWGQIALQGPKAEAILSRLTAPENIPEKSYHALWNRDVGGICCIVSRTGYTGSDGFELYVPADQTAALWDLLMETGKDDGLIPCGLGARDTLRLEASMPLYGHELSDTISPLTAGLGYFVKMDKPDFIGKGPWRRQASRCSAAWGSKPSAGAFPGNIRRCMPGTNASDRPHPERTARISGIPPRWRFLTASMRRSAQGWKWMCAAGAWKRKL